MRLAPSILSAVIAGLCLPAILCANPFDPGQVPAEAKWLLHIDMDAARKTKTWDALYKKLIDDDNFQKKVSDIEQVTDMQFPRDVQDVTVYGRAVGDEEGVIVLHGKIERSRAVGFIQSNASYAENTYGDHQIFSWDDKDRKLFAAFHDDSTIIVGRIEANIQAGLDVMDGKIKSAKDGPLASGAKPELLAYLAVTDLSHWQQADQPQSPIIRLFQSGWVSLREKGNDDVINAEAVAATADTAEQMFTALQGLKAGIALTGSDKTANPKLQMAAKALKTFHATQSDKVISVEWPIPLEQVTDFIATLPIGDGAANP